MEASEEDEGEPNPQDVMQCDMVLNDRTLRPPRNDSARFEAQIRESQPRPSCARVSHSPPGLEGSNRQRARDSRVSRREVHLRPRDLAPENSRPRRERQAQRGFRLYGRGGHHHRESQTPADSYAQDESTKKWAARKGFLSRCWKQWWKKDTRSAGSAPGTHGGETQ